MDLRLNHMRSAWEEYTGRYASDLDRFLFDDGHKTAMDTGKLTPSDVVTALNLRFNLNLTLDEFGAIWNQILEKRSEVDTLALSIAKKYPTYLLSNTDPVHHAYVNSRLRSLSYFRDHVVSYATGVEKPDANIYAFAEQRSGFPPETLIFIDDLEPNVLAAQKRGWKAILYTDLQRTIDALVSLGVEVDG